MIADAPLIEIEQLRKRADRERRARLEAESLAEQGTRQLYQRQRQLELLHVIADAANAAATVETAIQVALDEICAYTDWPVGHAYFVSDEAAPRLTPTTLWHLDHPERFATFRQITEATRLQRGEGLGGSVLASGSSIWIVDVTEDANFPRAKQASEIGVRGAFAFPVLVGMTVVAVLEFFSHEPAEPDEDRLKIATQVGTHLGRIFERKRASEALLAVNSRLHQEIVERQDAQESLHRAHELLEGRVAERTKELEDANAELNAEIAFREKAQRELEATHKRLLDASRLAGMAEVATSVLHNVGNVLNTVNTSIGIASEKSRLLKTTSVSRLAALLQEKAHDLPTFFATDPRGRRFPTFLNQVAENLAADQAAMLAELESLKANIEHINEIVAMQQSYATAGGFIEILPIAEVIEDALRLNSQALDRHGARLVRDYDPSLPPQAIDRHKTLQILVNLIRNAKHALDDRTDRDRCLTVRTRNSGDGRIQISVIDNGVGISPEHRARIFEHGFTTRKEGHGFGLHSSALAAREMGGSLTAHSAGPFQGATFTLELPLSA